MRDAIQKIIDQYESQIKFADAEPASYFREFVRKLKKVQTKEAAKVWVIMGNDYPESVYASEKGAEAEVDRLKKNDEERLKNQSGHGVKVYYRPYEFELES